MIELETMMSPVQAAAIMGLTRRQTLREVRARRLRAHWVNRRVCRIHPAWVREWTEKANIPLPSRA